VQLINRVIIGKGRNPLGELVGNYLEWKLVATSPQLVRNPGFQLVSN